MIEILGLKIGMETVLVLVMFVASEIIGNSNLKENSIAQVVKSVLDKRTKKYRNGK